MLLHRIRPKTLREKEKKGHPTQGKREGIQHREITEQTQSWRCRREDAGEKVQTKKINLSGQGSFKQEQHEGQTAAQDDDA